MATLIEKRTSDYTANETNKGIVWQRTDISTHLVKAVVKYTTSCSWVSSGGNLSTARYGMGCQGSQNAALCEGGYTGSNSSSYAVKHLQYHKEFTL